MWIADTNRCREIDHRATEEFGMPAMVLMERAGLAVFDAVRQMLPEGGRIAVLCGRGNNGGDGFVLARLAQEHGLGVDCLVTATEGELREECRQQMLQARAQGVHPIFCDDARWTRRIDCLTGYDLVVDAVLGIGAAGELRGHVAHAIHAMNRSGTPVISVDVPSGIHTDTGSDLGESVWALRTITFGLPKPYLFQGIGLEHAGYWSVADIGFPSQLLHEPTGAKLIDAAWVAGLVPERLKASHKGSNGHVLIVAGSRSMRGAAALAAVGALRSGAGMVTVAGVEPVLQAVIQHAPECTLIPLDERDGVIDPAGIDLLAANQHRFTSALFGPGLTHEAPVLDALARVWSRWETPCVIDADALNAVAHGVALPPCEAVLTPHPGEMGRLLQRTVAEVQADRFATVRDSVERFGKAVLLKGPHSIVGAPHEPLLVNTTGNPGMASAGMGDVLGGLLAALLGQELPPYEAAGVAMFWHGRAGDHSAQTEGPVGFTARDVARNLPLARAKLCATCSED